MVKHSHPRKRSSLRYTAKSLEHIVSAAPKLFTQGISP